MTDNKPIMIDGVDVSGCEFYEPNTYETCGQNRNYDGEKVTSCIDCYNCYYKQLKRKEQECKEYQTLAKKYLADYFEVQKECEELKEKLDVYL